MQLEKYTQSCAASYHRIAICNPWPKSYRCKQSLSPVNLIILVPAISTSFAVKLNFCRTGLKILSMLERDQRMHWCCSTSSLRRCVVTKIIYRVVALWPLSLKAPPKWCQSRSWNQNLRRIVGRGIRPTWGGAGHYGGKIAWLFWVGWVCGKLARDGGVSPVYCCNMRHFSPTNQIVHQYALEPFFVDDVTDVLVWLSLYCKLSLLLVLRRGLIQPYRLAEPRTCISSPRLPWDLARSPLCLVLHWRF